MTSKEKQVSIIFFATCLILVCFTTSLVTFIFTVVWIDRGPVREGSIWISSFREKERFNEVSTSACGHCGSDFVGTFQTLKHLNFTEGKWYHVTKWQNLILTAEEKT